MVTLFVILSFFMMFVITDFIIFYKKLSKKEKQIKTKQEIFFTPGVGFTMADGGEPYIEKKDEDKNKENSRK